MPARIMGMPRRYHDYLPQFQVPHVISTVGSWILAAGIILMLVNIIRSIKNGPKAEENPWGATTLEWQTSSPPPLLNFDVLPVVTTGPYDFSGRYPAQDSEEGS